MNECKKPALKSQVKTNGNHFYDYNEKEPLLGPPLAHSEPVWRQYTATLMASLISMGTGCVGGWSSAATPLLMAGLATDLGGIGTLTSDQVSWITSLINLGSLVGSLPAGQLSFYWGRRKSLLGLGVLLIIGWILIIYNFNNVGFIYLGRFICGFVAGAVCIVLAMYSNEVCSDPIRGRSGVFYDMMQVFGILFVYVVSAVTTLYWASILCLSIPILFLCTFYWMPETPLYLIKHGRKEDAIECIRWFHGENCDIETQLSKRYLALLEGKETEMTDESDVNESSTFSLVLSIRKFYNSLSKTTVKTFLLVLILFVIQRSSGAPIVVYYTESIFLSAHADISATSATVYTGVAQFLCTVMSVILVDHVGRRALLKFSFATMIASLCIFILYIHFAAIVPALEMNYGWIPVLAISVFVGIFRLGVGPIPWFMCAELIPTEAQRWALPTIMFVAWGMAFICSKSYLGAVAAFGYIHVFSFFVIVCTLGFLHTIFFLPETKNKSRLEIQEELRPSILKLAESRTNTFIIIEN